MRALRLAYRIWRRERIERKRLYAKLDKLTNPCLIDSFNFEPGHARGCAVNRNGGDGPQWCCTCKPYGDSPALMPFLWSADPPYTFGSPAVKIDGNRIGA